MKRRIFKLLTIVLAGMLLTMAGCAGQNDDTDYEKVNCYASWTYNYGDVAELAQDSDLIALVSINQAKSSYVLSGIRMTVFPATVQERIAGEEVKEIQLVMTGGIDEKEKRIYEIPDDPLMKEGEKYLIFARKNEDGTYTILGGPQGRFVLEDGKVYSLAVANEQVCANYSYDIQVDGMDKADFLDEIAKAIPQ